MTGRAKHEQKQRRERRLSAALRQNLRRRKAQAKQREVGREAEDAGRTPAPEPHDSAGIVPDKRSG